MYREIRQIAEKSERLVIGLMSGTSLDGVDAALVSISGQGASTRINLRQFISLPYSDEERRYLSLICRPGVGTVDQICEANGWLAERFAEAACAVVKAAGIAMDGVDFISSHGQTVQHMPQSGTTLQIGDISVLAARTGRLTVGDFRPADMAVGGQGAPLVPFVDALLFAEPGQLRALLNIGGIANITVLPPDLDADDVLAFDTGPGNALIDATAALLSGGHQTMDAGGSMALNGTCDNTLLGRWLATDSFLHSPPPKSSGREHYSIDMASALIDEARRQEITDYDIFATISEYTVQALILQFDKFIYPRYGRSFSGMWVGGGGVHNFYLMNRLKTCLNMSVEPMEALDVPSDAKEAVAFAVLGNQFLLGLPNNLPSVTGARVPARMGKLALPPDAKDGGRQV